MNFIRFVDGKSKKRVKNSKEASKGYDIYQYRDRDKEGNNLYVDATWIIQDTRSGHNNENRFVFLFFVKHWKAEDKRQKSYDDFSSLDWRIALFF